MEKDIFVLIEHLRGEIADISYVLLAAGQEIAAKYGGAVVALMLGGDAASLSTTLAADRVLAIDHPLLADFNPDIYLQVLAHVLEEQQPRLTILGDTSMGAELAGGLSMTLGYPLVSSCLALWSEGEVLHYRSQTCGGKIQAEGELPGPCALAAMIPGAYRTEQGMAEKPPQVVSMEAPALEEPRMTLKEYIEPDISDVDISKENILVAVGRGIGNEDNLEVANELVKALGGTLCASRPVVDQGWLPTTRLVGKSGKRVKPKLYITLGISGAPEHTEAIRESEMILAVNTDPAAPIFNIARYGTTLDLFDLVPELTKRITLIPQQ